MHFSGEPDNYPGDAACTIMWQPDGTWGDESCFRETYQTFCQLIFPCISNPGSFTDGEGIDG